MIQSDNELQAALSRINRFQRQVALLRQTESNPSNYRLASSGFLQEIDRMLLEVRAYLNMHPNELAAA